MLWVDRTGTKKRVYKWMLSHMQRIHSAWHRAKRQRNDSHAVHMYITLRYIMWIKLSLSSFHPTKRSVHTRKDPGTRTCVVFHQEDKHSVASLFANDLRYVSDAQLLRKVPGEITKTSNLCEGDAPRTFLFSFIWMWPTFPGQSSETFLFVCLILHFWLASKHKTF